MIQSHQQLIYQAQNIPYDTEESIYIQKIYSSSYYLCFSLRYQGKTQYLYLGRGAGQEGIWLSDHRVESFLRKRDKFLEYIRKHLSSTSFAGIEVDELDRIVQLKYFKWGRINRFYFFYNARNLYFANHFYDDKSGHMKLYRSWTMKNESIAEIDYDLFDELGRKKLEEININHQVPSINELLKAEKDKALKIVGGGKSKKFLNRKLKKIEQDLNNIKVIDKLKSMAEEEHDLSLMQQKNKIDGVKLNFRYPDHYKRRDEVYTKIKKLKKAEQILSLRKQDTVEHLKNFKQNVENQLKPTAPMWKSAQNKTSNPKTQGKEYKILQFPNFKLGIGTTAQANDQLRNEWAKKSDIWFHLDGDRSPHIILKGEAITLDMEVFKIVGSAMLDYSQLEISEARLIYTQVKNLKSVKGSPGKVIYKKEKRVSVEYYKNWIDSSL